MLYPCFSTLSFNAPDLITREYTNLLSNSASSADQLTTERPYFESIVFFVTPVDCRDIVFRRVRFESDTCLHTTLCRVCVDADGANLSSPRCVYVRPASELTSTRKRINLPRRE